MGKLIMIFIPSFYNVAFKNCTLGRDFDFTNVTFSRKSKGTKWSSVTSFAHGQADNDIHTLLGADSPNSFYHDIVVTAALEDLKS